MAKQLAKKCGLDLPVRSPIGSVCTAEGRVSNDLLCANGTNTKIVFYDAAWILYVYCSNHGATVLGGVKAPHMHTFFVRL